MSRYWHGCGTIDGSGRQEVVVAGDAGSYDESVELYSFAEETWRTGEEFNCYSGTCKISHFFNKRDYLPINHVGLRQCCLHQPIYLITQLIPREIQDPGTQ